MADFRLSARVISRAGGQSAIAAAAYRSGSTLHDARLDQVHDYSRKSGIEHTEIIAPDNAPAWMLDRQQLWNAVEAAEQRKNSQLARELQLSLPHELAVDDRLDLVRRYVREQFVDRGMIADLAIHAPDPKGDERNHHAHIMLTMRELAGDGFSPKKATPEARAWNSPELLESWREQWASYQNREFERRGLEVRVDHRSFQRQGIDREPTKHLGPIASQMERSGRSSEIGNDNRQIDRRNHARADLHHQAKVLDLQIEREKRRFERWASARRAELQSRQLDQSGDLGSRQQRQKLALEDRLKSTYGDHADRLRKEAAALDRRLEARGVRKLMRDVLGRTQADQQERQNIKRTMADIRQRENEQRGKLQQTQQQERAQSDQARRRQEKSLERGISKARQRREAEGWQPLPAKAPEKAPQTPVERRQDPQAPPQAKTPERPPWERQEGPIRPKTVRRRDRDDGPDREM